MPLPGKTFVPLPFESVWEFVLTSQQAIKHLQTARPALAARLPKLPEVEEPRATIAKLDCTPAKEVLGLTEFKGWKEVLEATIDSLVALGFEEA